MSNAIVAQTELPLILYEFSEINTHMRHVLEVYVTWFSFFLTLLLGAMAWSLRYSMDAKGYVRTPFVFFAMYGMFSVQLVFSLLATNAVMESLENGRERLAEIVQLVNDRTRCASLSLESESAAASIQPVRPWLECGVPAQSPLPIGVPIAMQYMFWTLLFNLVFWTVVAVIVWLHRDRRLVGSNTD